MNVGVRKTFLLLRVAASVLVLGALTAGCTAGSDRPATLSSALPRTGEQAVKAAAAAQKALDDHDAIQAVEKAEQAVALQPRDAAYRALLGRSYLAAGRFLSAATSLRDSRRLDPAQPRVGLNLALAEIALGDQVDAQALLHDLKGKVGEGDRGLALALAGDPDGAVAVLESVARMPGADARVRQNLALAYALAGRWAEARAVAAQDLTGEALDRRMRDWARFSQPRAAWQQVAALLDVQPALDPGQPVALALAADSTAVAAAALLPVAKESVPIVGIPAPAAVAIVRPPPPPAVSEVALPKGRFVVQLGAYSSLARIGAGWRQKTERFADLAHYAPSSSAFLHHGTMLHRLTVDGFATQEAASSLCDRIKAEGGDCFVRAAAGERPVRLALASR